MGTFITALVVFGTVGLVLRSMYRRRKLAKATGSVSCGCGCAGCSGCDIFKRPTK